MPVFIRDPASGIYYYEFEYHGRRFRGSTRCTSKDKAKQFERDRRREVEAAFIARAPGSREPMTWQAISSLYWQEVGQHHTNADTTLWSLDWLTREIGKATPVTQITNAVVARLVAKRRAEKAKRSKRPVAPSTVNRTVTEPLRKVLLRAKNIHEQPTPPIRWREHILKEPKERVRELRAEEEAALFGALRDDYAPAIRFALLTGFRLGEVAALTWDDVDFGNRRISVVGKGGKPATIPMPPSVRAVLWAERGRHTTAVFTYSADRAKGHVRRGDRMPITRNGLQTMFRRAVRRAGIVGYRFHDNRHTAATRVLRATGNLRVVQDLLRHERIDTTTKYAHVTDADVMAAMEAAAAPTKVPPAANAADGKDRKISE